MAPLGLHTQGRILAACKRITWYLCPVSIYVIPLAAPPALYHAAPPTLLYTSPCYLQSIPHHSKIHTISRYLSKTPPGLDNVSLLTIVWQHAWQCSMYVIYKRWQMGEKAFAVQCGRRHWRGYGRYSIAHKSNTIRYASQRISPSLEYLRLSQPRKYCRRAFQESKRHKSKGSEQSRRL